MNKTDKQKYITIVLKPGQLSSFKITFGNTLTEQNKHVTFHLYIFVSLVQNVFQ